MRSNTDGRSSQKILKKKMITYKFRPINPLQLKTKANLEKIRKAKEKANCTIKSLRNDISFPKTDTFVQKDPEYSEF